MNNFTYEANGITFANIKSRLALLLVLLVLLLSACSQKSNQGSVSNEILSAPLPEALLTTAVVFDSTNLLVELKVDGGEPQACTGLSVDQVNKTFSCSTTLSAGAHTLILIYSVIDATFGTVKVAETTSAVNVTIVSGQSAPADFSSVQLRILDDDEDGITNLDELDEGSDPRASSYSVGGTVSGLLGSGAVIQLNGGNDLTLSGDGGFNFIQAVADNNTYIVTVLTQPSSPSQTCSVANGSGVVNDAGADVTDVTVKCVTVIVSYTVGGTVIGLAGSGLVLQNNAGDDLPISLDGNLTFATEVVDGGPYAVTVLTQPVTPNQICSVTRGAGTISGINVVDVQVMCSCVLGTSLIGSCTLE